MRPDEREALESLLNYVEGEECHHDDTKRGGAIWTICNQCGQKWADDKGGFQPYVEPKVITAARKVLNDPDPLADYVQYKTQNNKFNDKSDEDKVRYHKVVSELMYLAVMVNLHTDYCVFLDYSGHVYGLTVRITPTKEDFNTVLAEDDFQLKPFVSGDGIAWLERKRDILVQLLEGTEVQDLGLEAIHEVITKYAF